MRTHSTWVLSCHVLVSLLLGCAAFCEADVPAAFVEGTPFHAFIDAHQETLASGGDPALGNYVGLFDEGYTALLLRVHLIRSARTSIDIQSFIWTNDECARVILYELVQAARRGVKVRILVDHVGSHRNPKQLAFILSLSPNIAIKMYRPLARLGAPPLHQALLDLLLSSGNNQRMHIKTCIIDGVAGITGGRNIGNNYFNYSLHYNFKDRDVLVVGPAVAGMTASFDEYWSARQAVECRDLRDVARQLEQGVTRSDPGREEIYCAPYFTTLDAEADDGETVKRALLATLAPAGRVEYVADAPGRKRRFFTGLGNNGRVTDALHELFEEARDSVVIQSPYVVVNRRLARFFRRVSEDKPGLRITISTNSYAAADHLVTYAANYRLRPRVVLDHGMEVFEYKPYPEDFLTYLSNAAELEAMAKAEGIKRRPYLSIHAKTFVFDEDTTFIGTMNLDPRSFYLNSEDGFIIEDTAIAQRVRAGIERDMAPGNSWTIARNRRPIFLVNRVLERVSARTPIDFWPLRSTSGFELRPGKEPISSEHPNFYKHYKDIGNFPGGEGPSGAKFVVRFLKVFGKPTTPLL